MKTGIYVAGKTNDWQRVRRVQEFCRTLGHEITYDWTEVIERLGTEAGLNPNEEDFRRLCAENDMNGVEEADTLIACVDYAGLCGTLIEIGVALGENKCVIVIGEPERNSVFFSLNTVIRLPHAAYNDLAMLAGAINTATRC